MKTLTRVVVFAVVAAVGYMLSNPWPDNTVASANARSGETSQRESHSVATPDSDAQLQQAFQNRQSDLQIEGGGIVVKVLRDDTKGSPHQRFLLRTSTGQTLLVAHNIELAPRIVDIAEGDRVRFYGEYEWNEKGGVLHWTHHDPRGKHPGGWLEHRGQRYE